MAELAGWRGEWPTPEELSDHASSALRIQADARDCRRCLDFLRLLERWAVKFNLISASSRQEVVDRHLLDSLAIAPLVGEASSIADFGSGAGFPGIPLAIVLPRSTVQLIESRSHRANFLRTAVRSLALPNARVFEGRGHDFAERERVRVDVVIARAVRLAEVLAFADAALTANGRLLLMTKAPAPLADPEGFRVSRKVHYSLPRDRAHALIELVRR